MSKYAENARRLKIAMKEADITQAELSIKTGIGKSSLSHYMNGSHWPDDNLKIGKIASVLDVDPAWLMGFDVPAKKEKTIHSFHNIVPIAKKSFPLFDGIAAGQPRLMPDGVALYVESTTDIKADYVLKVHGDSMVGARINDGDYVFIRQQPVVENGEIAAVAIGEEATLKRFYRYGEMVILRAENPEFKEMIFSGKEVEQIRVLGKAVAFQSDVR